MTANQTNQNGHNKNPFGELARWVQTYARYRGAGPFVVQWVIGVVIFGVLIGCPILTNYFLRHNNYIGACISSVLLLMGFLSLIIFSMPRWGGKWAKNWGLRLYDKDGQVTLTQKENKKIPWHMYLVGFAFAGCVLLSVILGKKGFLPEEKYMLPISALYCIPFMIYIYKTRPVIQSKIMWLWPILYALHALAILFDIPPINMLSQNSNMFIAGFGYGAVTAIAAYVYSRYAFYRLKKAAQKPVVGAGHNGDAVLP